MNDVLFDPGFAQHTTILSMNIEYLYTSISKYKNFGQKKTQFKMYYPKIMQMVENNIAFCLGSLLWAVYIKNSEVSGNILNNPCLDSEYDEAETVEEIDFSKNYFQQLQKDTTYYLGQTYKPKQEYYRILDVYREFLVINKGFVKTKTTGDLELPKLLKKPTNLSIINNKIQEVVKNGKLTDLFEIYGLIL